MARTCSRRHAVAFEAVDQDHVIKDVFGPRRALIGMIHVQALAERRRLNEAKAEYREILRRRPDLVDARVVLAEVLAKRGHASDATAELRTAQAEARGRTRRPAAAIDGRLEAGVEMPAAARTPAQRDRGSSAWSRP